MTLRQAITSCELPGLSLLLRARARRRLRHALRGYACIRLEGRLTMLSAVMAALTNEAIDQESGRPSRLVYGAAHQDAEIATRQYLMIRVMGSLALNSEILRSIGDRGARVVHPLPLEWRDVLAAQGIRVARARCALAWWAFVGLIWVYGVLTVARYALNGAVEPFRRQWKVFAPYAYFVALSEGNLPRTAADGRSHDIVTWYSRWDGRPPGLAALAHSAHSASASPTAGGIPVVELPSAVPPLTARDLGAFLVWATGAVLRSAGDLLLGRWWNPLMLAEASHAAAIRLGRARPLAVEYLFHGSNVIYRPLWTYEAAARGSKITFYFYSTNSEAFKREDGYTTPLHSWQVMTWPRILVWDTWQEAFVRRAIGDRARIDIVGPIWFHSSPKEMPDIPPGSIAVFDVQPQRTSRSRRLGTPNEYYSSRVAGAFLSDVYRAASENGCAIAFKRKRHIGPLMHRGYGRRVDRLAAAPFFVSVDPDVSAVRVIERCTAVVSMPFTSTALLGREAGKPSIYYDPAGLIERDDRAAHGIPIVKGFEELRAWARDTQSRGRV